MRSFGFLKSLASIYPCMFTKLIANYAKCGRKNRMNKTEVSKQIEGILNRLLSQKGHKPVEVNEDTRFLGGSLPLDSLDLAVMVTELQCITGTDPFRAGFKNFQTVGELAGLYAAA